jgi:hypothetical protein
VYRIGRPRGNVDKGRNLGVDTDFGDNHAREGVTDQYGRTLLHGEDALRRRNGFLQRRQRVLHRSDLEALRLEPGDDLGPARPIGK